MLRPRDWIVEVFPLDTRVDEFTNLQLARGRCALCERCWIRFEATGVWCVYGGPFETFVDAD